MPLPRLQNATAFLLLVLILLGLNAHLFVLQIFGWSGMLLDYRQTTDSWTSAAQMTVSGDAPCEVCRHVETAFLAAENVEADTPAAREIPLQPVIFPPLLCRKALVISPPSPSGTVPVTHANLPRLAFPPASPPPRFTIS